MVDQTAASGFHELEISLETFPAVNAVQPVDPLVAMVSDGLDEEVGQVIPLECELVRFRSEETAVRQEEVADLRAVIVDEIRHGDMQVDIMQVFHVDGVEGADLGRAVNHDLVAVVNEERKIAHHVGDERFAFGIQDDPVYTVARKAVAQGRRDAAPLQDAVGERRIFQSGRIDHAVEFGRLVAALGDDQHLVVILAVFPDPADHVAVLCGEGGGRLDEVPVGRDQRGRFLVQRGDHGYAALYPLQDGFQLPAVPGLHFFAAPPFQEFPGGVLLVALA